MHPGFSDDDSGRQPDGLWFQVLRYSPPAQTYFLIPLWFLILLVATAFALPWTRWFKCFSLRTLLITTTLVAAVLGLVVWLHKE
jgi:NADH:ubiquinone oxidoreductase subunit 3 (subunit A)